ncbi:MAG: hypothetical protein P4L53_01665 [Candidatus Obscuribacterales bacterium]|nr:hypothetical protein [Candidatus Obscuribacterales bacterium]
MAGRYNADSDGPAQYFADTPDGAWAEFVRHAEITDKEELLDVRRSLWAVEIADDIPTPSKLPLTTATGGRATYAACQHYARSLRNQGQTRIHERSAALIPGGARGQRVNNGVKPGPSREGTIIVIFDYLPSNTGWCISTASPPMHVFSSTKHY